MSEQPCPSCKNPVILLSDGRIDDHYNWANRGAYMLRCAASGRDYEDLVAFFAAESEEVQR